MSKMTEDKLVNQKTPVWKWVSIVSRGWENGHFQSCISGQMWVPNTLANQRWNAAAVCNLVWNHEPSELIMWHRTNVCLKLTIFPIAELESVQQGPGKLCTSL